MRGRLLNWPAVARLLGFIAVAVAIAAAVIHLPRHEPQTRSVEPAKLRLQPSDELLRELAHCQSLGAAANDDRDCDAAWAENRRRFFSGDAPGVRPGPSASARSGSTSHP